MNEPINLVSFTFNFDGFKRFLEQNNDLDLEDELLRYLSQDETDNALERFRSLQENATRNNQTQ